MKTPKTKDNLELRRIAVGLSRYVTVLIMSLLSVTSFPNTTNNSETLRQIIPEATGCGYGRSFGVWDPDAVGGLLSLGALPGGCNQPQI